MKTATFVKKLVDGFTGDAKLYKLSEPMEYGWDEKKKTDFVIVSATNVIFSGPETYIFPASEDGKIVDWGELDGSFQGGLDHERALAGAGYEIK